MCVSISVLVYWIVHPIDQRNGRIHDENVNMKHEKKVCEIRFWSLVTQFCKRYPVTNARFDLAFPPPHISVLMNFIHDKRLFAPKIRARFEHLQKATQASTNIFGFWFWPYMIRIWFTLVISKFYNLHITENYVVVINQRWALPDVHQRVFDPTVVGPISFVCK